MIYRLLKMILILTIVPMLHIITLILIGIANHHTAYIVYLHWYWSLSELAFLPYALSHGYYPSNTDIQLHRIGFGEFFVAVGFVILCWLISTVIVALILRRVRPLARVKLLVFAVFVVGCFGFAVFWRVTSLPPPLPEQAIIHIDTTQSLGELTPHHRGFSQGGEGQMMQVGYFEQAMSIMQDIQPRYIRIDHLYDYYNVLSFDASGEAVYDFSGLDRIVDAIIEAGAQPLMSLSYAPPAMNPDTVYAPPNDLDVWGELIYETVRYYNVERGLDIRYWELWNEPNLPGFWNGTIQDYLDMYTVTARAVKRADESALVGGPAVFSADYILPFFYRFTEENWVTGVINHTQNNNLPLDFISWHLYSTLPHAFTDNIAIHKSWFNGLNPKPELLLTEWNFTGGKSQAMDTGETTAYLAQTLALFYESDLTQVFYFEPIDGGEDWIGRWGLLRADGTRKPSFYAYTLFDRLDGIQLLAESNHPDIGAIATQANNVVKVLVWNNTRSDETITITIAGITQDTSVELYGVDAHYGNSYGKDATTETFIETLILKPSEFTLDIPTFGIRLLEIAP